MVFSKPKYYRDVYEYPRLFEEWMGCPVCASANVSPAVFCDCGHWSYEYYLTTSGEKHCPNCIKKMEAIHEE